MVFGVQDQLEHKRKQCPQFMKIVDAVIKDNPLHIKRLHAFITTQDDHYWEFCERMSRVLNKNLFINDQTLIEATKAYNELCRRMLKDQIQFRKTGKYVTSDASLAREQVYDQSSFMYEYMLGLLLTQMFWPNHYALFQFFRSYIREAKPKKYLEVGAGHGLFVAEASQYQPKETVVCDISEASLNICQSLLKAFEVDLTGIQFVQDDFFKVDFKKIEFDFITMGEVLEHVDDAPRFIRRVHELIHPQGRVFMSTCANCPAPDHVYHFHNINEIRDLIRHNGFLIENEIYLASEDVPQEQWEEKLVTVNYAAILKPKKKHKT